jgi:UDP-3-O-[3-hydroxymyristoyl] glucosamine N-acyltransferase
MKLKLSKLAEFLSAKLIGDPNLEVDSVAPIQRAQTHQLTYLVGGQYRKYLKTTQAGVVIISEKLVSDYSGAVLIVENPELAFARVLREFFEIKKTHPKGVHPTAFVDENADIHPSASIGPKVSIGEHVRIASHVIIHAGVVLGDRVTLGEGVILHANATILDGVEIGAGSIIYSGAVLGSDGFGYVNHEKSWEKIPQIGRLIIGKNVEVGANTTIDRGAIQDTVIGDGVKIDNLVQIGHNVEIGEHTIIAGCTGIAGSAKLGKHCMVGGAVAINGHVEVCDGTVMTGTASIMSSIDTPGIYASGFQARPYREWFKVLARMMKLEEMEKRLANLERLSDECDG